MMQERTSTDSQFPGSLMFSRIKILTNKDAQTQVEKDRKVRGKTATTTLELNLRLS